MSRHLILSLAASFSVITQAQAGVRCDQVFDLLNPQQQQKIDDLLKQGPSASKLKDNQKLQLATLFQTIEQNYGPLLLKSTTAHVDWAHAKTEALRKAGQLKDSNEEYYQIADFLFKFNDAHVSISLPSSLTWSLPLQVRVAEGQTRVTFVEESFPKDQRAPKLGDELVQIDGQTPAEFQKKLAVWNANGNEVTNESLFALGLGRWREERGLPLSNMNMDGLKLTFKSHETGEVFTTDLKFKKEGQGLIGRSRDDESLHPQVQNAGLTEAQRNFRKIAPMSADILSKFHELMKAEVDVEAATAAPVIPKGVGKRIGIGEQAPFFALPKDFKRIEIPSLAGTAALKGLFNDNSFFAGTFMRDGKRVGFLRIPSYSPANFETILPSLRFFIAKLEAESDYLVIDQTNNPGGMVVYSDFVTKSLVGKYDDSKHLRFSVKPNQRFMRQYMEIRDMIAENKDKIFTDEEAKQFAARFDAEYQKIYQAYLDRRELSEPISMRAMSDYFELVFSRISSKGSPVSAGIKFLLGVDVFAPQVYTKKVYFMINELDFSGGDATPATLQDYGRVKLVGTRTAGAGGTVEEFSNRGSKEFEYRLTTSLMVRKDGNLVENYGVKPDIEVPMLASDIVDQYTTYFERTLKAIDQDLKSSK